MRKTVILLLCLNLISCGTVKKLLKRGPKEDETVQKIAEDNVNPEPLATYGVLKTQHHFLPSYRDVGGPHLKIDSLKTVLYLNDETLQAIDRYINESKRADSTDNGQTVRYYNSKFAVNELLAEEISPEKAAERAHFKGIFDQHGNLHSLEFIGEQSVTRPDIENLKFLYASYWNLFTNSRVNYVDNDGNRPNPHIKFYSDAGKHIHRVEYLNANKDIIAVGEYTFGVKYMILEQRIIMPKGGKLTDLHPDYFYRQYDRVEPGWVIKCLYEQKDRLSDLIVMQDDGVVFYRYRFKQSIVRGRRIVEAFVYNPSDELVGRYELYFDENGDLEKKIYISGDRNISGYSTYSVDLENLKIIVDSYDHYGKNISRIYRGL